MTRLRNAALFVLLSVLWGSAFTAIKAGLDAFPPVLFAALRYDLAGIIVLAYAVLAVDRWRPATRGEWTLVTIGSVLMIAAYHAFLFVGEQGTTSAAAAIIVSLSPVLTTAFARGLLPDERLTAIGIVGLLVGFVGVVVLSEPDPSNLLDSGTISKGLVLLAAASFALGSVLTKRVEAELPIETMEAWSMLGGALVMHAASLAIGESFGSITWSQTAVVSLGYLVIAASVVGFLLYFYLLDVLGPIEINLVSYAAPVAAAVTGIAFLGETPDILTVVGFACILVGFLLLKRAALRDLLAGGRASHRD